MIGKFDAEQDNPSGATVEIMDSIDKLVNDHMMEARLPKQDDQVSDFITRLTGLLKDMSNIDSRDSRFAVAVFRHVLKHCQSFQDRPRQLLETDEFRRDITLPFAKNQLAMQLLDNDLPIPDKVLLRLQDSTQLPNEQTINFFGQILETAFREDNLRAEAHRVKWFKLILASSVLHKPVETVLIGFIEEKRNIPLCMAQTWKTLYPSLLVDEIDPFDNGYMFFKKSALV